MSSEIEKQMIDQLLDKIRSSKHRKYNLVKGHSNNLETLTELGYTDSVVLDIILSLKSEECLSSFEKDKGGYKGYVFEFGRVLCSKEVYIKFRVLFEDNTCHVICISFHFAKYELRYRFK